MSAECTCHDLVCHAPWCPAGREEFEKAIEEKQHNDYVKCKTLCKSFELSNDLFDDWWEDTGKHLYKVLIK